MLQLPRPTAFTQAAVALRAIIREKREGAVPFGQELVRLYWLAVVESLGVPHWEAIQQSGANVLEAIPGSVLPAIDIDYQQLGYAELGLLGASDRKIVSAAYGEPRVHSALIRIQGALWQESEDRLKASRNVHGSRLAP